ncbi:MarR family winged helix-turn-helix transcriptional regulator [Micromonospora sp. WMMD558]|uniref:MarR family winged helix-turn-helix transcriptional regulator n=1 Tax=Micromonospora sp. WMMD558 TaxID=3403462 RepID=UPI003BF47490
MSQRTTIDPAVIDGMCNCFAMRKAARYLTASYDKALAPAKLRATQFTILHKVATHGETTISTLAAMIGMDRTTLATNLKPLERDGLLTTAPAENDRRARIVQITAAGHDRLEQALPLWQSAQNRFEDSFGSTEASSLRSQLRAVLDTGLDPWAE